MTESVISLYPVMLFILRLCFYPISYMRKIALRIITSKAYFKKNQKIYINRYRPLVIYKRGVAHPLIKIRHIPYLCFLRSLIQFATATPQRQIITD